MKTFFDLALQLILDEKNRKGSFRKLCEPLGLNTTTVQKWFTETTDSGKPRSPNLSDVGKIFDDIGITLIQKDHISTTDCAALEAENARLRAEVERLRTERDKAQGQVELLKEQLADERGAAPDVMPFMAGGRVSGAVNEEDE